MAKKQKNTWKDRWEVWVGIAIAFALMMAIGWIYPVKLTLLLTAGAVLIVAWDKRKGVDFWFFVPAVIGPVGDMIAISGGAWTYAAPVWGGIPLWLPAIWGLAGIVGRRVVEGGEETRPLPCPPRPWPMCMAACGSNAQDPPRPKAAG